MNTISRTGIEALVCEHKLHVERFTKALTLCCTTGRENIIVELNTSKEKAVMDVVKRLKEIPG